MSVRTETEAYVEAELDPPPGFFEDEELGVVRSCGRKTRKASVLARRVSATAARAHTRGGAARAGRSAAAANG